jgi:hypothetical protein
VQNPAVARLVYEKVAASSGTLKRIVAEFDTGSRPMERVL